MLIKLVAFAFLIFTGTTVDGKVFDYKPQQVHLAFGDNVSEIVVTWSTMDDSAESIVEYGINGFTLTAESESEKFVDGGSAQHTQYIHKDYGYTRMKAFNTTHLYFEQISVDKEGAVIDSFWIIKDSHGEYSSATKVAKED